MSVVPSLSPSTNLRQHQHDDEEEDDDKNTDAQITPATTPTQVESTLVNSSRSESVISLEEHEENKRGEETKAAQETDMDVILSDFENRALNLVRQSDRRFPFKQSIIWKVEFDEDREYSIHIMSNKRRL